MTDETVREPRRWNFWLIASLCLNFFLIGVVVTGLVVARNRMIAGAMGEGGGLPPEMVLQMLPRSGAVKMCDVIAGRIESFRKLGREVVDARRAMFKLFRAEPFDANAFRASLTRLTAAQVAVLQERQASIADVVVQLTPEERKHFTRKVVQRFLSLSKAQGPQQGAGRMAELCRSIGATNTETLPR
jgi:uncharacterized membrane protein